MMADRREAVGRDEGELGTLRSVIDGLWAHGERPALVAVGEEGVKIPHMHPEAEERLRVEPSGRPDQYPGRPLQNRTTP